jgi:hypothetical protein
VLILRLDLCKGYGSETDGVMKRRKRMITLKHLKEKYTSKLKKRL